MRATRRSEKAAQRPGFHRPAYPAQAPFNFLGLEGRRAAPETSRYVVLPLPFDATTSYRSGARFGPDAVIAASRFVEFYDEELGFEPCSAGVHTLPALDPDSTGVEKTLGRIRAAARAVLRADRFLMSIGGDHSVSPPLVQAHAEKHGDIHVLQFDAHSDLRNSYGGSPHSHACAARRMGEHAPVVAVGIRSMTSECRRLVAANPRFHMVTAREVRENKAWVENVLSRLGPKVYVSLDLDALDPSIMPATGTPEPGGLLWYEVLHLLRRVAQERSIVGADVVELCPMPPLHAPDFLAARLVYKIIGYVEGARRSRR